MASALLDPEKIRESFPNPTIPKIHGTHHSFSIAEAHAPLNKNATSVYSSRGNPALGHYILTELDAEYLLRAGIAFIITFNPGVHPIVAPGATDAQIAHVKREHEESTRKFRLFKAVDNALKNQLVNAIDDIYIKDIRDRVTGFATSFVRDIIQYLYRTYRLVTPAQLTANDERFRAPYDGSTDLEAYFNGIDDCLFMSDKANQPYSEGQTLTAASSAITESQRSPLAMREWHKLPDVARTWADFKATLLAEQKIERDNGVAPASAYANNAHGGAAAEALNNLSAATAADRQAAANQAEAVANLSGANQKLANQLQQYQKQIQQMMAT